MTLASDFDGVVHGYSRGWHDGTIYDEPLPGAIDGLRALMRHDATFIHTSRDPEQVAAWLTGHGLDATTDDQCHRCLGSGGGQEVDLDGRPTTPAWTCDLCKGSGRLTFWNERGLLLVTDRKLPARAYLDDLGVRFHDWDSALTALGITNRLLDCGFCYEEWGEEVHPHPECPTRTPAPPADTAGQHTAAVTRALAYTVSLLPETHRSYLLYALFVERDYGTDTWKIRVGGQVLDIDGVWEQEGLPRRETAHRTRRFPLDEALRRAHAAAPHVTCLGRTAADALREGSTP